VSVGGDNREGGKSHTRRVQKPKRVGGHQKKRKNKWKSTSEVGGHDHIARNRAKEEKETPVGTGEKDALGKGEE